MSDFQAALADQPDLCGHRIQGGRGKRHGVTGSLEEMDQFRLNWVETMCLLWAPAGTSAPDRWDPAQGGASAGSVMFYFFI